MQLVQTMRRTPGRAYTYPPTNTYTFGFQQRHGDGQPALGSDLPTLGLGNASVFDGVGAFGLGGTVDPSLGTGVAFSMLPPLLPKTPSTISPSLPPTTMTIPLPLPATTTYSNYNYVTYSTSASASQSASTYQSGYPGAPPTPLGSAPTPGPGQQGYSSATSTPAPGQGPSSSYGGHHGSTTGTTGLLHRRLRLSLDLEAITTPMVVRIRALLVLLQDQVRYPCSIILISLLLALHLIITQATRLILARASRVKDRGMVLVSHLIHLLLCHLRQVLALGLQALVLVLQIRGMPR